MATGCNSGGMPSRVVIAVAHAAADAKEPRLYRQRRVKQNARELTLALLDQVWCTAGGTGFILRHHTSGQPIGEHPLLGWRQVSVSHSHSWYAGATSNVAVGIDLQQYRTFSATARRLAFTVDEHALGYVQTSAAWAIREAFLKSHGQGLPYPLRDIHIDWQQSQVSTLSARLERRQFWLWYSLEWVCALCFPTGTIAMPDTDIDVISCSRGGYRHEK
ncbi:4'-phosphopantetheinyl transferase superfamily protein [Serratia plymuthica]|nr:4'-phosphopantetheinyl transferase superfamily protein [Serratia plymuthica]CAI1774900.1 Uncharacterised protein [Serratia plymuthica]